MSAWDEDLCGAAHGGVVWAEHGPAVGAGAMPVIAPEGPGAWRHSPWPVADALFALAPAPISAVLVAGGTALEREAVADALHERDAGARLEEALTLEALRRASVVVLLGGQEALPALTFAPLAARRVLVVPRRPRTFGLQDGLELFAADDPVGLAVRANTALRHPDAFDAARVLGAVAAEHYRASAFHARLAEDLRGGRAVGGHQGHCYRPDRGPDPGAATRPSV